MELPKIIELNFDKLIEICNRNEVKSIYAFGSVVSNHFNPGKSDLDFVVEMEKVNL